MSKKKLFNFLRNQNLDNLVKPITKTFNQNNNEIKTEYPSLHYPVMYEKVNQIIKENMLNISENPKIMIDCTLGLGGHSIGLLKDFNNLHILGIDCDERMINFVKGIDLAPEIQKRFCIDESNFSEINLYESGLVFPEVFGDRQKFDIILADFGINSLHLEKNEWGISYIKDGKLDMRYNNKENTQKTAADLLNTLTYIELKDIITNYGEEPLAEKLAKKIIEFRKNKKFENSQDLKNLILDDENNNHKFKTIMRVFQALRISVNNEIENLTNLLDKIPFLLTNEGLAIFITFHSLEHNLVKKNMLSLKKNKKIEILKNGEKASEEEIIKNKKSQSAKIYAYKLKNIMKEILN